MTAHWTLTTATARRVDTIIGSAPDHEAAVTTALAAALDAIHHARAGEASALPRYELRASDELVAVIQTGTDTAGRPDHTEAATLIQRIEASRSVGVSPY
ncbi:hypothetical protein [Mycobacterium sp. IS-1556]|uniref:hypothetical protein n=1 Tax=Mycobacterium sp. IS-1556 TaxID=1772276 RepID=UPI00074183D5|nr:hypothetical protein [Mycobacterium sp. IS-1556]KUH91781.1 hypothetical protein AU187_03915 [Mycobacterium sp. IS-1556]